MKTIISISALISSLPICISCNNHLRQAINHSVSDPGLLVIAIPFLILGLIVGYLWWISNKHLQRSINLESPQLSLPLTATSGILGIGLGGFIDGIVFHQILQWHEMLSNKIPTTDFVGKSVNMFWDGIFHGVCLIVVLIGIVQLWRLLKTPSLNTSGYLLLGGMLGGWGIFNIVEGVLNHQILKLHNVQEQALAHNIANLTFLGLSVVLIVVGYFAVVRGRRQIHPYQSA